MNDLLDIRNDKFISAQRLLSQAFLKDLKKESRHHQDLSLERNAVSSITGSYCVEKEGISLSKEPNFLLAKLLVLSLLKIMLK